MKVYPKLTVPVCAVEVLTPVTIPVIGCVALIVKEEEAPVVIPPLQVSSPVAVVAPVKVVVPDDVKTDDAPVVRPPFAVINPVVVVVPVFDKEFTVVVAKVDVPLTFNPVKVSIP